VRRHSRRWDSPRRRSVSRRASSGLPTWDARAAPCLESRQYWLLRPPDTLSPLSTCFKRDGVIESPYCTRLERQGRPAIPGRQARARASAHGSGLGESHSASGDRTPAFDARRFPGRCSRQIVGVVPSTRPRVPARRASGTSRCHNSVLPVEASGWWDWRDSSRLSAHVVAISDERNVEPDGDIASHLPLRVRVRGARPMAASIRFCRAPDGSPPPKADPRRPNTQAGPRETANEDAESLHRWNTTPALVLIKGQFESRSG